MEPGDGSEFPVVGLGDGIGEVLERETVSTAVPVGEVKGALCSEVLEGVGSEIGELTTKA